MEEVTIGDRTFVPVATKDLREGDVVFHESWRNLTLIPNGYLIENNDGANIKAKSMSSDWGSTWSYTRFQEGWMKEVTYKEYSPDQNGDCEDDI